MSSAYQLDSSERGASRPLEDIRPILLRSPEDRAFGKTDRLYHDGIELEKGVVITSTFLENNEKLIQDCIEKQSAYPDVYLDLIQPSEPRVKLFFYQRIWLRACMRYRNLYITAARATSKTFLSILAKYLQCMFIPGYQTFIVAPNKQQASKIAAQKIHEIWLDWPLLENEVEKANFGKDYVELVFKNGSHFAIVGGLDSDRGLRNHGGLLDEVRDLDGDAMAQIVLPQLNVSRRTAQGVINPHEKTNQQVIAATSAGSKSSQAYSRLIDTFEQAIINPKEAFCIGLDWRIPAMHGLIDPTYVQNLKLSPSYDESTFLTEYMGYQQGGSEDSQFQFQDLEKRRHLKNPEWHQKTGGDGKVFYIIATDVGRLSCDTVACIFRINVRQDNHYYATLVNIFVLGRTAESKTFTQQAIDLKKLIALYNPRECLIDTNGLGVGLGDEMIKSQMDAFGEIYPPYGFTNDVNYKKIQPKDCECLLYSMKANAQINSKIHSNTYSRINGGYVNFLISEQEARAALLATEVGQKMKTEDRIKRILPHELTTKLFEEMANLRLKKTGMDITLEQINTHFPKDKYSAFSYGLQRIKEMEEENFKRIKRHGGNSSVRQLVFFTEGD